MPRPPASRDDATAKRFLRAAAYLIDAYLDRPREEQPPRLKTIHFPAALDWLDVEDVIRLAAAQGGNGVSRHAFYKRWPSRDDFLPEAVVYALLTDEDFEDSSKRAEEVPAVAAAEASFSSEIIRISTELLESLQRDPRNYLTLHIGPLLPQHPLLWEKLLPEMQRMIQAWADGYAALLTAFGLTLRPGWTPHRVALALQAMLDGFVLRYRILPDDYQPATAEEVGIFADTVTAFVLGVIDADRSGVSVQAAVDALVNHT
jgi:AcrR family transcriptional regulator